jgi:cobalt-zinc-cadmium efflux system outer membrane protein
MFPKAVAISAISLGLAAVPAAGNAQTHAAKAKGARAISFAEARAAAERVAPHVLLAEYRANVSRAAIDVAGALLNPSLAMTTAKETARLAATLSVPVPLFGQRDTSMQAARADAEAVELDVRVVRREARRLVTIAWADLWEEQERARLLELAGRDLERLFDIAKEKFDAGSGSRLDVVRTRADRARARAQAEAARLHVAAAAARLALWIGTEMNVELIASGKADYAADLIALDALSLRIPDHPELNRDRAEVRAADAHIRNEKRLRWPILSPLLTVTLGDPTLPGPDVIVGLSLDLPVLNLRGASIARAREQRALAEATANADARRLRADLLDAYRRTQGARSLLIAVRDEVLPSLEEARKMTEEGYRIGRVDLIRVFETQRALLDSRLAEVQADAAWVRAMADLERAAGLDLAPGKSGANGR